TMRDLLHCIGLNVRASYAGRVVYRAEPAPFARNPKIFSSHSKRKVGDSPAQRHVDEAEFRFVWQAELPPRGVQALSMPGFHDSSRNFGVLKTIWIDEPRLSSFCRLVSSDKLDHGKS